MCFNDYITDMCIMDSIENYLELGLCLGYHVWIVNLPHAWTVL